MILRSKLSGWLISFMGLSLILLPSKIVEAQILAQNEDLKVTKTQQETHQSDGIMSNQTDSFTQLETRHQEPLNGSLLMEDLVNQLIERSFKNEAPELELEKTSTSGEPISRRPVERASGEPPVELQPDDFKLTAQELASSAGEWSASKPEVADEETVALMKDAEDRHIQYDVMAERVEGPSAGGQADVAAALRQPAKLMAVDGSQINTTESGKSSGVQRSGQARAISSSDLSQVQSRNSGSQLTRPPYASHDQFGAESIHEQRHGHDSMVGERASARQETDGPTNEKQATDMRQNVDGQLRKLTNSQVVELSPLPASDDGEQATEPATRLYPFAKRPASFSVQPNAPSPNMSQAPERFFAKEPAEETILTERHLHTKDQQAAISRHRELIAGSGSAILVSAGELAPSDGRHSTGSQQSSNQEFESSNSISDQQAAKFQQTDEHSTRPNIPQGAVLLLHRVTPPTHYAASLVNVTAPMVLPLSASEAMESALGGDQVAKGLLQQASGLLRPSSLELAQAQASRQGQGQRYSSGSTEQMISPPANQLLATRTHNGDNSTLNEKDRQSPGTRRQAPPPTQQPTNGLSQVTPMHQASGFRSPLSHYSSSSHQFSTSLWPPTGQPSAYLSGLSLANQQSQLQQQATQINAAQQAPTSGQLNGSGGGQQQATASSTRPQLPVVGVQMNGTATAISPPANGFVVGDQSAGGGLNRRQVNLTRVEHISAECSNDLIRSTIVFNGTFKGIIYSAGYVRDSSCLYVNGTGKSRYEFSIRLNQCGTLGRQELHHERPHEIRRRDHLMWNTLSIQYNPMIEQEWDEHFRVSCEYGSDFWKTVSFSPFNVETNTGAPVVFTVDPPKCQMEILRGHGMVGPRQEVVSGPVTVGDPLTLLIHMKSEKAGYDILVKNCIAHNGGHQKMQLIDANGCVVNERFISPFRGTYNDNDLKHVTLYSYLKAFRFTGSPVLYLECEIHMCQSSCPPQMCYWRRLSKRSLPANQTDELAEQPLDGEHHTSISRQARATPQSDSMSLFQAIEVRQERPAMEDNELYALPAVADLAVGGGTAAGQLCYRRSQAIGLLLVGVSLLAGALSLALGCCWRAKQMGAIGERRKRRLIAELAAGHAPPPATPLPRAALARPPNSPIYVPDFMGQPVGRKCKADGSLMDLANQLQQPKRLLLCDY